MTEADKHFKETCEKIIKEGISTEGTNVRPRWEDGSMAHTKALIGVQNVYNVGEEFPMITYRDTGKTLKGSIDELLWIWQKKSNNINDLNSKIWDQWADEEGSIGKAYGYQMGLEFDTKTSDGIKTTNQVDFVLDLLKNDPASRRIMTNIFKHEDLKDMVLEPCVYGTQWLVKNDTLHLILNQRSQDMLAANGWNTMQYSALLCMFAQVNDLKVGTLTHNIGDCHIYDRHIPMVEEMLDAGPVDCNPHLNILNPTTDFYDFTPNDFEVSGYQYNKTLKLSKIPVAK